MSTQTRSLAPLAHGLRISLAYLGRPVAVLAGYRRGDFRADLVAGLTVAVVMLPQAIAFAFIAGLPPQMGVYGAVLGAIVGALWGSSHQLHTGPNNTASLLVLSVLLPVAAMGSPEYIAAAGLLAVMVGVFRLLVGLARLGMLANFVSDAVIVGFTAGAGVLIAAGQLKHLLRLPAGNTPSLVDGLAELIRLLPQTHLLSLGLGLAAILLIVLLGRFAPRLPGPLITLILSSAVVGLLSLNALGVGTVGELPRGLPPLAHLPLFDLHLIGQLSAGALALAAIGLVEATSIARSLAAHTGQRLDSNQEFVGQGLANIASGVFSGFSGSASFNRSTVNHQAGARTGMAAVISGVAVLLATLALGPLAAHIPNAVLAGVLILFAYRMIDRKEMARILRGARGDALIMVSTLSATLLLPLEFAVLTGILMSLAYYLLQTSTPQVLNVLPDERFKHFGPRPDKPQCPQLAVVEVRGDLYFGAVNHVEEQILNNLARHPGQRYLLLRMNNVQQIDISGIHMLESLVRTYREQGGDVFLVRVRQPALLLMETTGFMHTLGRANVLDEDNAIEYIFHRILDPGICIYECETRAFFECQNLPRPGEHLDIPLLTALVQEQFTLVPPRALFEELRRPQPPLVVDVREPREFRLGHIPQAQNIPLPRFLKEPPDLPHDRPIVLACRTARRSRRAAHVLHQKGYDNVRILDGGMVAWDDAALLEAVDEFS